MLVVTDLLLGLNKRYFSQYSCLALWFIGGRKRDAVEATCTKVTLERTDMGKGQVAAALSNFRSLAAIFGPPIAARIYTYGVSVGNPGIACKPHTPILVDNRTDMLAAVVVVAVVVVAWRVHDVLLCWHAAPDCAADIVPQIGSSLDCILWRRLYT